VALREIAEEKIQIADLKEELIKNHQRVIEMDDSEDVIDTMQGEEEWNAIAAQSAGPAYEDIDDSDEDREPSLADLAGTVEEEEL
jgi:DNA-directed RNA polymerase subunit omega